MADNNSRALTGAVAIIKVKGVAVGKMRDIRINDTFRRIRVSKGLGSIMPDEFAVTEWAGTLQCSFFEVDYLKSGIRDAIKRNFGADVESQIASGNNQPNFEDQLVLDIDGVDVEVYKKLTDVIDVNTGFNIPKTKPYVSIRGLFIETDNVTIQDGQVAGRDQTFHFLHAITN